MKCNKRFLQVTFTCRNIKMSELQTDMYCTYYSCHFGAFLKSSLIFAKKYVHFSKQFLQTAPHNGFPAKACNLLKIFSSSLTSKYLCQWTYQPSEWKVLVSLFTNKIVKMLSHVVNITVLSVSVTWCKLWQQFGWQLLYWNAKGCTSYVCHISISKVQIYTLLYVGYWLKETG